MKDLVASIQNAPRSPRRIFKSFRSVGTNHKAAANTIELQADRNLTQFLTVDCPTDVLPKILAYAGPISAAALKQTSRHFRDVLNTEGTWRGLCEELYKWKPGEPEPSSWKQHYRRHPCVPVDFSCISTALAMAGAGWSKNQVKKRFNQKQQKSTCPILEIPESITVLVRPGKYEITEAIGISTMWRTTQVKIQRMQVPKGRVYVQPEEAKAESSLELKESDDESEETFLNDVIIESKTRRRNEPVIRVFRGQLVLDSIKLEHYSPGVDIWNGNAAIQVQPSVNMTPIPFILSSVPEASAVLNRVDVRSYSGRGVVAVEGGHVHLEDCHIHHCAATGLYVGGNTSLVVLKSTDVVYNGMGNQRTGGIARGHSGVYVEQSKAELQNCSVSQNTSSGITVIAPDNSALKLSDSEVVANGCTPMEIPNPMDPSAVDRNNRVAVIGTPKPRSIMLRSS